MTTQTEFFLAHQVDGQLTDEQMAEMLTLPEGDTSALLEGGQPEPASDTSKTDSPVENATTKVVEELKPAEPKVDGEAKPNPEPDPVILAKDGKHTISYDKLVEAREGEKHWKAQAEAAQQQLDALKAEAAQRVDAGAKPTPTDNAVAAAAAAIEKGVDPAIFGDFSEKALAQGIEKLVQMRVDEATTALRGELKEAVQPLQKHTELSATEAHFKAIYTAHPDADSVAESAELAGWIDKQPSMARDAYKAALEKGSAAQVIELFDAFKAATVKTPPPVPDKDAVAAAAKAAIAQAKSNPPTSLSEIPAGSAAHHDEASAMLEMSSTSLLNKFESMSPDKIAEMLNRAL